MKICGMILRVLAVLAAIALCVVLIQNHQLQRESLDESRDELADAIEEHEEEVEGRYQDYMYEGSNKQTAHDKSECSTCEYLEEREKTLDRSESQLMLSLIQYLMIYSVLFSGMLFALGAILSKMGCAKAPVAAPAPVAEPVMVPAPVSNVCPNCGTPKQPGVHFCGSCGTPLNH